MGNPIEKIIGGASWLTILIYSIARAGTSRAQQPDSDTIALELVLPITILIAFVAFAGYSLISETVKNDLQLCFILGTLLICSIWFSLFQFIYSTIRKAKVA